jgi:putative MATE family efflux protein
LNQLDRKNEQAVSSAPVNNRDFTRGPVSTHLMRLTGFMMVGLISVMGANLVEAIYIGRVGADALAALSFTFPLIMLFQGISMGLAVGASSVVARVMGAGDREQGKLLITHCVLLVSILVFIACIAAYHSVDVFFMLLGADDTVLPLAVDYIHIWIFGLPFFTIAMVGSTLMRAAGDAVTPGYLMTIGSMLHILISPVFIFGMFGAPEMGLSGAAVGFVLARSVSFLMYSYVIWIKDKLLVFRITGFISSCRAILHVGLPAMASNMIQPLSMGIITRLLAGHGSVVVAGFGVASRIESIAVIVIISQSMSIAPFIGQNWGAKLFARVTKGMNLANGLAIVWGVFAYTALFFLARPIISLISEDLGVVDAAVTYLRILPLSIGFMGVLMNSSSCFNALGLPMPPLVLTFLQMIVIQIPLALLGNYLWGYTGIFVATAFTISLLGVASWFWLNHELDKGMRRQRYPRSY